MVFSSQSTLLLFKRIFPYGKPLNLFSQFPKPFTSLPQPPSAPNTPNPSSLSAKMSFVFDQIDAIERQREEKDQTLQRIRAWRESKKINISDKEVDISDKKIDFSAKSLGEEFEVKRLLNEENGLVGIEKEVELVHPWKEWIELIERLVGQKYFDYKRRDEDAMMEDSGFRLGEVEDEVRRPDFTKDWRTVETALLNFGRDRFDILRSLARQDLQILVGYGCPSTDKRTTFAAKVLRKYVHLDEGDVCSSCSLRSSCERAYLLTNKEDEARTIDVMRILLTYGFDPINGPVLNKSLQKLKSVKTIVRKLLHEVVKLSAVPIDPNLSPPVFKKPPPKVKQPPPAPKKRVGRDDIEMKKGDWLCPKCDFMNFAKNTICLQCDAKRPKRQLLPGEWECPQCNFLNYRRNVVCFHCECNRPQDEYMESHIQEKQSGSRMRTGKVLSRQEVSNAWNFNFDDDESDGADVASFENADSSKRNEDFSMDKQALGRVSGGYQDSYNNSGHTRMYERNNSSFVPMKSGTGFNDFSDEDDDVDNYEVDNRNESERASCVDFSDLEANSGSDSENGDSSRHAPRRTSLNDGNNPSRRGNHKSAFSRSKDAELDFGSDDDLPIHPNWKSSHVANPKQRNKHGGALSFGSDEDIGSDNEGMDGGFRSSRRVKDRQGDNRNRTFSDFGSDDERDFNTVKRTGAGSTRNTSKGGALRGGRRQFSGTDDADYSRNARDNGKSSFDRERSDGRRGNSQSFGGSHMRSQNQQQGRGALRGGRGQFTGTDDKYSRNDRDNGKSSFDRQRSDGRRGNSQSLGGSHMRSQNQQQGRGALRGGRGQFTGTDDKYSRNDRDNGKSSFDRQRSDGRRGNSQSLGGSNTRSHQERGRSTDRDSYYDDERFQKPRNNVR